MRFFCLLTLLLCSANSSAKLISWEHSDLADSIISKGKISYDSSPDDLRQSSNNGYNLIEGSWRLDNVKTTYGSPSQGFETANLFLVSITDKSVEWAIGFSMVNGLKAWNQAIIAIPKDQYITAKDPLGALFDSGWTPSVRIYSEDFADTFGKITFHSVKVSEPSALALMLLGLPLLYISGFAPKNGLSHCKVGP